MRVGVVALARRPSLWLTAAAVYAGLVPSGWWRRSPYLPVPDRAWVAFRMETAYGDPAAVPGPEDLIGFLAWARATRPGRHLGVGYPIGGPTTR